MSKNSLSGLFLYSLLKLVQYTPFRGDRNEFIVNNKSSKNYPTLEKVLPWSEAIGKYINNLLSRIHPKIREGLSFNQVCVLRKIYTAITLKCEFRA